MFCGTLLGVAVTQHLHPTGRLTDSGLAISYTYLFTQVYIGIDFAGNGLDLCDIWIELQTLFMHVLCGMVRVDSLVGGVPPSGHVPLEVVQLVKSSTGQDSPLWPEDVDDCWEKKF